MVDGCNSQINEINVIKINKKDSEKGFYTLLTNGTVKCLKDNRYVVPTYCLGILKKDGINFKVEPQK